MAKLVLSNEDATEDEVYKAKSTLEAALGRLVENSVDKNEGNSSNTENNNSSSNATEDNISSNTGNTNTGNSNNVSSSTSSNGNSTNKEQGKLPNTGGRAAGVIGIFGTMISAIGVNLFKKKR